MTRSKALALYPEVNPLVICLGITRRLDSLSTQLVWSHSLQCSSCHHGKRWYGRAAQSRGSQRHLVPDGQHTRPVRLRGCHPRRLQGPRRGVLAGKSLRPQRGRGQGPRLSLWHAVRRMATRGVLRRGNRVELQEVHQLEVLAAAEPDGGSQLGWGGQGGARVCARRVGV